MTSVVWLTSPAHDDFVRVVALLSDFGREVIPGEPDESTDEIEATTLQIPVHRRMAIAVATKNGEVAAGARLGYSDIDGRRHTGDVSFFVVRPEDRRKGVGSQLLRAVTERARADGRTHLRCFVPSSHAAGTAFAAATGAVPGLLDRQNRLETRDLDRGLMESWVERAQERAEGYSLVSFDDACPERWLGELAEIAKVMNTAPHSEGDEGSYPTGEQLQQSLKAWTDRGGWTWTVCARDDATGRFAGYTELGGTKHRPWLGQQGDTGVDPAHRGRGIGRWVKAVNALRLLDERPEVTVVDTYNAGVNAPMLSINDAMGFRPVATWQEWTLEL